MTNNNFDPKRALQLAKTIYFAIIGGCLVFLGIVFYIATEKFIFKADLADPLFAVLVLMSLITIPAGFYYSGKLRNKIGPNDTLASKFSVYQTGLIIRMACCEGIALFSIVYLLLTNNSFSLVFFVAAIIVMMGFYPTPEKVGKEINLSASEIELF